MDLTYAVADLHGAHAVFARALVLLDRHAAAAPGGSRKVVFLGDYIDRGPRSREILSRLMAGPPPGWQWLCLRGNHEQILAEVSDGRQDVRWWIDNGGGATLRSYDPAARLDTTAGMPRDHIAWARSLPPLAVDRYRVFVHAGVDPALPLDEQTEHDLLWSRERNHLGHQGRFVVHGHTPHPHGPVVDGRSINLDTLAWSTGRLVIGVFDDAEAGGPTELIEVIDPAV